jgi:hypothetical protein
VILRDQGEEDIVEIGSVWAAVLPSGNRFTKRSVRCRSLTAALFEFLAGAAGAGGVAACGFNGEGGFAFW